MDIGVGVIGFCGHSYLALKDWEYLAASGINLSLKALCATGESTAGAAWLELQQQHDGRSYTDWHALIQDPAVDLVVVDGPYHLHAGMFIEALKAGKHVFCEKSIALHWQELQDIESLLANSSACAWSMMNMRYSSGFYTVLQALREGCIGCVKNIKAQKSYKHGQRPAWYNDRDLYGGTELWVGSHALDLLVAAGGPIASVQALHDCADRNYEMLVQMLCRHRNGALSSASLDFYQPAAAAGHSDDRLHVTGTEGVIEASHGRVRLVNDAGEQELPLLSPPCDVFADGIMALAHGTDTLLPQDDMLNITRACLAARDSADHDGVAQVLDTCPGVKGG